MPYNEALAAELRCLLAGRGDVVEKRMFGGLTFMVSGHMCCGVAGETFVFRVGAARYEAALAAPLARPCDFTRRPLVGMVMVATEARRAPAVLKTFVEWSLGYILSLPAKP
jgi:TfoX/Sxy family transcriptional regulator of competence genes